MTARKKNQLLTIEVVNGSERTLAALSLLINAAIALVQRLKGSDMAGAR